MKKVIKLIMSIAIVAIALMSCQNGFAELELESKGNFALTVVADNLQRTEYDADLQDIKWSADDKVNIIVGGNKSEVAATIDSDNPRIAAFTYNTTLSAGEVLVQGILGDNVTVSVADNRASRYSATIASHQRTTTTTFDKGSDILVADDMAVSISDDDVTAGGKSVNNFHFSRKVAISEFTYKVTNSNLLASDERVKSVTFEVVSADSDKFIAGQMYLQPTTDGAKYVDGEGAEITDNRDYFFADDATKVTVSLTDKPLLKDGFKAWFVTAPITLSATDKLIFTVTTTAGTTVTKSISTVGKELSFSTTKKNTLTVSLDENVTVDKSIKLLAIGNSFSDDATKYLYGIFKDAGYNNIVVANLYIAGCSLETHATNFAANSASYTYRKNDTGTWRNTSDYAPLSALADVEWDYISMQQTSGSSGVESSYEPYLGQLINIVTQKCPDAELIWHMTWAYQGNSTHKDFPTYNSDQMTMYNAIVSSVRNKILTNNNFVKVIPTGTAVQNMRTSYIGDALTRDGYHMSYDKGRLLVGLTFAKALVGLDLSKISYTPDDYTYSDMLIATIKDAAEKACANPYQVTTSAYPPETATLESIIEANGYNPADYKALELDITNYAYYNSTSDSISELKTGDKTSKRFVATTIFEKSDIPNGSLLVLKSGYQYRPEGWTALDTKSTSRPGNVSTQFVVVDDTWWGDWNYRAFNLAVLNSPDLTEQTLEGVRSSFGIFVPTTEDAFEAILESKGYDTADYTKLDIEWHKFAYYYSRDDNPSELRTTSYSATTAPKYVATQIFEKTDIPNGSIIIIQSGYQYRPEGWTALDAKNSSSTRPGNVSTEFVVVDDAWWGNWNYRAFNVSTDPAATFTEASAELACSKFRIYTPKQ